MRHLTRAIILTIFFTSTVEAQPRLLGYVNGVCSTREQSETSLIVARHQYIQHIRETTGDSTFDLAEFAQQYDTNLFYNRTSQPSIPECVKIDFLEAALQQGMISQVEEFWQVVEASSDGLIMSLLADHIGDHVTEIREIAEFMAAQNNAIIVEDLEAWASRRQVVLITHSQGNFFGNDSWLAMDESLRRSVGLVGVATPDDIVADGGNHFTHRCDPILWVPGALGETLVTPTCDLTDWECHLRCHVFITYMSGSITGGLSKDSIVSDIYTAFSRLDDPPTPSAAVTHIEFAQERFPDIFLDVASTDCTSVNSIRDFKIGQRTRLRIFGQNLRDVPVAAFIEECDNVQVLPNDPNPEVVWRDAFCTPSFTTGTKYGVVKDFSGGNTLCEFEVDIVE